MRVEGKRGPKATSGARMSRKLFFCKKKKSVSGHFKLTVIIFGSVHSHVFNMVLGKAF